MHDNPDCSICNGKADDIFRRVEVWSSETWKLSMSTYSGVAGFCYLEPKRHIEYITDLTGKEAEEFGGVLSRASSALKKATGAKLIYAYIYGDHIPHLHVHIAPHVDGDAYYDDVIREDAEIGEGVMTPEAIDELKAAIKGNLS